jgi:hypothetical protein
MLKDMHHNIRSNNVSDAKVMATEQKAAQKKHNVANVPKITRHTSVAKTARQHHAFSAEDHMSHGTTAAREDKKKSKGLKH